jgi:catechol 2,3-dioxygenase-like lactoylglutathione lyase family enzyme
MKHITLSFAAIVTIACAAHSAPRSSPPPLGQFSISLAVKDLRASRAFYESLGFVADDYKGSTPKYGESWLILRHGDAVIGLFHGLFDKNALTFNPPDVRAVQRAAKARGIAFALEADGGTGPAAAMTIDPDGNPVLIDQH